VGELSVTIVFAPLTRVTTQKTILEQQTDLAY